MAGSGGEVRVTVAGTDQAQAAIRKLAAVSEAAARGVIAETALAVQAGAKRRVPVDTGRLRSSIRAKFTADGLSAIVWTDVQYAAAIEHGRGAGKKAPPSDALAGWLQRHGGDPRLAYVVARSIGEDGFPARPFLRPAAEEQRPMFWQRTRAAMLKALKEVDR